MNQTYADNTSETLLFPELELHYAGFWDRFGAAFIDGLILLIPEFAVEYIMGTDGTQSFLFNLVLNWLYFSLQESGAAQATIGKKALGLKVTNLSGDRISFGQATGRFFGKYLSAIILFIGYLMMLWDEKKQTLHDKMAGTLVLKQVS
jgi:uncharacterized RDD family membrane protein YckC